MLQIRIKKYGSGFSTQAFANSDLDKNPSKVVSYSRQWKKLKPTIKELQTNKVFKPKRVILIRMRQIMKII